MASRSHSPNALTPTCQYPLILEEDVEGLAGEIRVEAHLALIQPID
jgi:hypothetical protein